MIKVLTPATNRKLATLSQIKLELGIEENDDDNLLNSLILRMSGKIEDYCHRTFAKQVYEETISGKGKILLLTNIPIIYVTSVTCDGDPIVDYEIYNDEAGELYRDAGWTWDTSVWWGKATDNIKQNFTVVYCAGYLLPGETGDGKPLPSAIEDACIQCVKEAYLSRRDSLRVTTERIGNYSVSYDPTPLLDKLLRSWVRIC